MAQSSAPIVNVNLSDADWRDLFGDEPGVVGDLNGSAYAVTLPTNSDAALIGSSSQPSIARVAGFKHVIPTGQPEPITIPPASSVRTDIIALEYNPSFSGQPGPVRLVRIAGTNENIPYFFVDDAPPGVEHLPLHAITRRPGEALSQATVRRLFGRLCRTLEFPAGVPLPLSAPLGTRARLGRVEYIREVDSSGSPAWRPTGQPQAFDIMLANNNVIPGVGLRGYIDGSGFKQFTGSVGTVNSFTGLAGSALFFIPPAMLPTVIRRFEVPLSGNTGPASAFIDFHPDGWVRIGRDTGSIPGNTFWYLDAVRYLV